MTWLDLRTWKSVPYRWLILLTLGMLLTDTLVLARWAEHIRLPGEISDIEFARRSAWTLVQRYQTMAREAGVIDQPSVRQALQSFASQVAIAGTPEQLASLVQSSYELQRAISREQERVQQELLLAIINRDPRVQKQQEPVFLTIQSAPGLGPEIHESTGLLTEATREAIQSEPGLRYFSQVVQIEVANGVARVLTPTDQVERLALLRMEIEGLTRTLHEVQKGAGLTPLRGPGVIVKAADAPGGYYWNEIVHEQDIREIVNALLAAGADGVDIGGQRVISTFWVRCVGPVVVVNGRSVAANPVVIRAVGGDPRALADSLRSIRRKFAADGKRLDVQISDAVTVAAYQGKLPG